MDNFSTNPRTLQELYQDRPDLFKTRKRTANVASKPKGKKIAVGAKVLVCGCEMIVVSKHQNKNWWSVKNENGYQTACDRSLIKVI